MVLKEANNTGTTGHVVTAVEKEYASACKLAMQMVCVVDSKSFQQPAKACISSEVKLWCFRNFLAMSYLFNQCILLTVYSAYDYIIQMPLIESFCWASLICGCPFDL